MPTILLPEHINVVSRVLDRHFGPKASPNDSIRDEVAALALQLFGLGTEDEEELFAQLGKALSRR